MVEISNKTIAVLLIATICVYLAGTLFTFNKLSAIRAPILTGLPVSNTTGIAKLEIQANTVLEFDASANEVNWGTGYVDQGCTTKGCVMIVNGTVIASSPNSFDSTCCKQFYWVNDTLLLRNAGNLNLTVEMNISKNDSDATNGMFTYPDSRLFIRFVPTSDRAHRYNGTGANGDTASPCSDNFLPTGTDWSAWTRPKGANVWYYVCGNTTPANQRNFFAFNNKNEVNLDLMVNISFQEPVGTKNTTITCRGTSD